MHEFLLRDRRCRGTLCPSWMSRTLQDGKRPLHSRCARRKARTTATELSPEPSPLHPRSPALVAGDRGSHEGFRRVAELIAPRVRLLLARRPVHIMTRLSNHTRCACDLLECPWTPGSTPCDLALLAMLRRAILRFQPRRLRSTATWSCLFFYDTFFFVYVQTKVHLSCPTTNLKIR